MGPWYQWQSHEKYFRVCPIPLSLSPKGHKKPGGRAPRGDAAGRAAGESVRADAS